MKSFCILHLKKTQKFQYELSNLGQQTFGYTQTDSNFFFHAVCLHDSAGEKYSVCFYYWLHELK